MNKYIITFLLVAIAIFSTNIYAANRDQLLSLNDCALEYSIHIYKYKLDDGIKKGFINLKFVKELNYRTWKARSGADVGKTFGTVTLRYSGGIVDVNLENAGGIISIDLTLEELETVKKTYLKCIK